jgi:glycosyltransferase involved in cell wall biosynthesis
VFAIAPKDHYVQYLKKLHVKHINVDMHRSGLNPLQDFTLLLKFITIYGKYKPDIIQHFTVKPVVYGTLAARICRIKCIFNMIPGLGYVFTGTSFKKNLLQMTVRLMYRISMTLSRHVFFQNQEDRGYFTARKIASIEQTSVVPGTGVDLVKFRPRRRKKKRGITFIVSARMLWDKGIREYVEAAKILKAKYNNINFWLLGPIDDQNPKSISKEQLEDWNAMGYIDYFGMTDNIRQYLSKADIIVLPSYYKEGIPLSLLEGAAMGMPIITTDSTGCREVVENGKNGFLVPVKNVETLAAAMEKFIKKPVLTSRMGRESRKIASQRFDSRFAVSEILKCYPL